MAMVIHIGPSHPMAFTDLLKIPDGESGRCDLD